MPVTRRWTGLVIALAILIAAVPVVHTHPTRGDNAAHDVTLSPDVATPCAVCATTNARITVAGPTIASTAVVVEELCSAEQNAAGHTLALTLPSRAPPLA